VSFVEFFLGLVFMGLGFVMVWKGARFTEYFGDLGYLLGFPLKYRFINWRTAGVFLLFVGFIIAFSLIPALLRILVGNAFLGPV
jgi:hypothetical protein